MVTRSMFSLLAIIVLAGCGNAKSDTETSGSESKDVLAQIKEKDKIVFGVNMIQDCLG